MPRIPTHSLSAAPAVALPFFSPPRSRTRRDDPRRPAYGRDAAPDRGRSSAALDAAPPCRLGPRALRAGVLSRDDPNGPARPQAVLEESQKLLGRADPERRQAFIERVRDLLAGAQRDEHLVVFLDEAHIHQDCDLGYGWGEG